MDPNANLQEQESILERMAIVRQIRSGKIVGTRIPDYGWETDDGAIYTVGDRARLLELRAALIGWLQCGGFAPDWNACPRATKNFARATRYVQLRRITL